MTPKNAFRRFGDAALRAPPGTNLTLGLAWIETRGWRVMMNIHTSVLHLGPKEARGLAAIYDKQCRAPEWRGKAHGLEWVAPTLRELADEAEQKNLAGVMPDGMLDYVAPQGRG